MLCSEIPNQLLGISGSDSELGIRRAGRAHCCWELREAVQKCTVDSPTEVRRAFSALGFLDNHVHRLRQLWCPRKALARVTTQQSDPERGGYGVLRSCGWSSDRAVPALGVLWGFIEKSEFFLSHMWCSLGEAFCDKNWQRSEWSFALH